MDWERIRRKRRKEKNELILSFKTRND